MGRGVHAGLCLSLSDCFAFEGFERKDDTTCKLIHEQDICIGANQNQTALYVGLNQTDNTIKASNGKILYLLLKGRYLNDMSPILSFILNETKNV